MITTRFVSVDCKYPLSTNGMTPICRALCASSGIDVGSQGYMRSKHSQNVFSSIDITPLPGLHIQVLVLTALRLLNEARNRQPGFSIKNQA